MGDESPPMKVEFVEEEYLKFFRPISPDSSFYDWSSPPYRHSMFGFEDSDPVFARNTPKRRALENGQRSAKRRRIEAFNKIAVPLVEKMSNPMERIFFKEITETPGSFSFSERQENGMEMVPMPDEMKPTKNNVDPKKSWSITSLQAGCMEELLSATSSSAKLASIKWNKNLRRAPQQELLYTRRSSKEAFEDLRVAPEGDQLSARKFGMAIASRLAQLDVHTRDELAAKVVDILEQTQRNGNENDVKME